MQYRRSIFLIDRPFQIRFSIYVCSWLLALCFVYPLIIYNLFEYFIRYAALDPMGPTLAHLDKIRHEILFLLIAAQVLFMTITFMISVFMSHRIAGPLYKMRLFFEGMKKGDLSKDLYFRKKDHFQILAADFNDMMRSVKGMLKSDIEELEQAIERLEKSGGSGDVLKSLRDLRDRERARLGI